jgi:hypothetical protein
MNLLVSKSHTSNSRHIFHFLLRLLFFFFWKCPRSLLSIKNKLQFYLFTMSEHLHSGEEVSARDMQASRNEDSDSSESSVEIQGGGDGGSSFMQFEPESRSEFHSKNKLICDRRIDFNHSAFITRAGRPLAAVAESSSSATTSQTREDTGSNNIFTPPRFEFINTTGPEQYSEANARSRARAHVMRQVHVEKDKERATRTMGTSSNAESSSSQDLSLASLELGTWPMIDSRTGYSMVSSDTPDISSTTASGSQATNVPVARASRHNVAFNTIREPQGLQAARFGAPPRAPVMPPSLPSLIGMEQRLVVPRTVTSGGFSIDLNAVENVRHCKLQPFGPPHALAKNLHFPIVVS